MNHARLYRSNVFSVSSVSCSVSLISGNRFIYTLSICADLPAGPEGACIIPGLLRAEKRLQTQESGDRPGAEERGVPQSGEPA